MAVPVISNLPPAPTRNDGAADFSTKADAFVAALPPMVTQENALAAWQNALSIEMNSQVSTATGAATAAASSASAAAGSVTAAQTAAQTAQIAAAASGASAGIGQLGNPGDSLQVNPGRTGLVFGPSDGKVGDVLISARNPGPLFVPANGGIRAQSALPSLLGVLGLLGGQVGQQYATLSAGTTTTVVDVASAPNPNGGAPRVMQIREDGGLNFSSNGGATWTEKLSTGIGGSPASISYDEFNKLWVCPTTIGSEIRTSTSDGDYWLNVAGSLPGLVGAVGKVMCDANGVWIAIGINATTTVWRSTDKGATWSSITTGASAAHTAISTDNKGVWCVAAGSTIRRSVDGGLTWTVQFTASSTINAISNDRNGVWLISGLTSNSNTYKSVDNGLTWTLLATPVTSTVTDIAYSQGFFFLVRSVSPQLIRISSAADATVYTVPTAAVLASLIKVTATAGYVVAVNSANTTVLRSAPIFAYDTSSQFQLPNFPVATGLQAWIKAGLVRLSSGKSFTAGGGMGVTPVAMDTDGNGVLIAVQGATIRRSSDYGATWATEYTSAGATLVSVATNGSGLWIVGAASLILRSTNNGITFSVVPPSDHGFTAQVLSIAISKTDSVIVGATSSPGIPRRSLDGGLTWSAVTANGSPPTNGVYKVAVMGLQWVMAQGGQAYVGVSGVFGAASTTGGSGAVADVKINGDGIILVTSTSQSAVRRSIDKGVTWAGAGTLNGSGKFLAIGPGSIIISYSPGSNTSLSYDRGLNWIDVSPSILFNALAGGQNSPFIGAVGSTIYNGTLDTLA